MNYVLSPGAEAELKEAVAFYAQNVSLAVAENFLATFEQKASLITDFPGIGTPERQQPSPVPHRKVSSLNALTP